MNTAALVRLPHLTPANQVDRSLPRGARAASSDEARAPNESGPRLALRPRFLYGDSTPFPHDGDFVDTLHQGVVCGVSLMQAHHAIQRASAAIAAADRMRREERVALLGLADAVKRAVTEETAASSDVARRTGGRALAVTRAVIESELAAIEEGAQRAVVRAEGARKTAHEEAAQALADMSRGHDLPGTEIALGLVLRGDDYEALGVVATPYGLEAAFTLSVPAGHPWAELRRVGDLEESISVHVPRDAGWFSKRVELQRVKLDKHFVREVTVDPGRCALVLSKNARGAGGLRFELDPKSSMRVLYTELPDGESGAAGDTNARAPYELGVDDAASILRLWRTVERSTRDLGARRGEMRRAHFDGKPLATQDPLAVCDRLVRALAPTTREIARRAGAPGEFVLRRDAGARRRDEIYITTAELAERIDTLPPPLRRVFDPLGLDNARSPRAPAPSLPAFVEIEDADILE